MGIVNIENKYIPLCPDSQVRIDAINTIKYTFLLDYNPPEYIITPPQQQPGTTSDTEKNDEIFLRNVFFNCLQCCDKLLRFREYYGRPSSFFGKCQFYDPFEFFSSFAETTFENIDAYRISTPTLQNLILQHCVISCYHAMITEKNEGKYSTPYQMVKPQNTPGNKKTSSTAANFTDITTSHITGIPLNFNFIEVAGSPSSYRFPYVLAPCWKDICGITTPVFKTIYSPKHTIKKRFDNILQAREKWSLSSQRSIEGLHNHYLLERIFHFDLFYHSYLMAYAFNNPNLTGYSEEHLFLKSISDMISKNKYIIISMLHSLSVLPNTFSRQYFLLYALCSINEGTNSASDFWHNQSVNYNHRPRGFDISMWIAQFNSFIRYLSDTVIPVFEWCFTGMLLEGIEKALPSETHENHLDRGITILSDFIGQNYELYHDPMSAIKNSTMKIDTLFKNITNFIVPTSGDYDNSLIQKDILVPLLNSFYSYEEIEVTSDGVCITPFSSKNVNLNITDELCPEVMSYLRTDIIELIKQY